MKLQFVRLGIQFQVRLGIHSKLCAIHEAWDSCVVKRVQWLSCELLCCICGTVPDDMIHEMGIVLNHCNI